MGEEFKDFEVEAPVLTLEPDLTEEKEEIVKKEPEKPQEPAVEEPVLSPQEQKIVEDFAAKIDIENTNQILQYGAGTQKKMADFSDAALVNVKTQDLGEAGELLANVVGELKDFDATEEKGFFGFFKKQTAKVETLKNRYTKAEGNVTKITEALEQHQMRLMKDSAVLDKMYEQNLAYFKELSMYILAGKKKLREVREGKLNELHQKAAASGLPEDAQAANDLESKCDRFEKKLHDLELTKRNGEDGTGYPEAVRHTDRYPDGTHRSTEGMDPRNRVITGFSSLYITLSTKKQTAVFFSVVCFFIISSLFFCTKRAFSFCFMICAHITYLFSRISQTHIPDQSMSVLHSPL